MTTLGEIFAEFDPLVTMYAVTGENGLPLIRCEFDILPSQESLTLPQGPDGDPGPDGNPGPVFDFRAFITNDAQLTGIAATLGSRDVGKTWINTTNGNVHYWKGSSWLTLPAAMGTVGPAGPANNLTMGTVTSSPPDGFAGVTITGSAPNQTLNLTLPRGAAGPTGATGPASAIVSATDYDDSTPPADGSVIAWNGTTSKWNPVVPKRAGAVVTLANSGISTASTSGSNQLLGSLTVPSMAYSYRVLPFGVVYLNTGSSTDLLSVTVFEATTSLYIGSGSRQVGSGSLPATIVPYSSTALTTTSSTGVWPAGSSRTFYVYANRLTGSSSFNAVSMPSINGVFLLIVPN